MKRILVAIILSLLATTAGALDHEPVFPRTDIEFESTDRLMDELTIYVHENLTPEKKERVQEWLDKLDRTRRADTNGVTEQNVMFCKVMKVYAMELRRLVEEMKVIPPEEPYTINCGLHLEDCLKKNIDFGTRYHIKVQFDDGESEYFIVDSGDGNVVILVFITIFFIITIVIIFIGGKVIYRKYVRKRQR